MILMEDCNDGWDGSFSSKHHFFFINYLLLLLNCFLTIAENLSRVKWCRLLKIHNNNNSASAHHATFQNYVAQAECIKVGLNLKKTPFFNDLSHPQFLVKPYKTIYHWKANESQISVFSIISAHSLFVTWYQQNIVTPYCAQPTCTLEKKSWYGMQLALICFYNYIVYRLIMGMSIEF